MKVTSTRGESPAVPGGSDEQHAGKLARLAHRLHLALYLAIGRVTAAGGSGPGRPESRRGI
jgi:hypothetical protein